MILISALHLVKIHITKKFTSHAFQPEEWSFKEIIEPLTTQSLAIFSPSFLPLSLPPFLQLSLLPIMYQALCKQGD